MLESISTGLLAGALHVIFHSEHWVAMAPMALRKPRAALKEGLAWGLGHSVGVIALSLGAILMKDLAHLEKMSSFSEFAVAFSLLVVGILAIRTSLGMKIHRHIHSHDISQVNFDKEIHEHLHLHLRGNSKNHKHSHASTSLGLLHGLAGASHLLAVIPAFALPNFAAILYMIFYLAGSMITMSVFVLAVSKASLRYQKRLLPMLIGFAGGISIITGLFWLQKVNLI